MLNIAREVEKVALFLHFSRVSAQSEIGCYQQTDLAAKNPPDTVKRHFRLRWRRRYLSKAALTKRTNAAVHSIW